MKKIYASMIALAMGAFITAGARTYQRANINFDGVSVKHFETVGEMQSAKTVKANAIKKVKANANDEWISLGEGTFYEGIFGVGEVKVEVFENSITANYYQVPGAFTEVNPDAYPLFIDATDPTNVIIPEQETNLNVRFTVQGGQVLEGPLTIMSFSEYAQIGGYTPEEFKAEFPEKVIDMTDGVINIPESAILGIVGTSDDILMINNEMLLALPGSNYVPDWGDVAMGRMLDTFFEAGFRDYVAEECDVLVQKHNKVDGAYRIIDPWYRLFGDTAPDRNAGYYFVIDASNPDCVVVPYQSSYINTGDDGVCYLMSMSANYETIEDFLNSDNASCNFKMDTETKTINFTGSEVKLSDGSSTFVGPIFFVYPESANPNGMYVLRPYETPGYIKIPDFTGISSVAVDNNDAKAEYYNIQGVRVNNPIAGQLYIVKKGNQVSKQVIR